MWTKSTHVLYVECVLSAHMSCKFNVYKVHSDNPSLLYTYCTQALQALMCTKNTRLSKFNVHKEHTRYPSLMCTKRTDPPSLVCTQHIEVLQVQCALSAHRPSMCCGLALEDCISYPPPHDQCGLYHHVFLFYPNHTVNEPVLISLKARVVILPSASSPFQPPGTPERWT